MDTGVRVVDLSLYLPTRDTRPTFRPSSSRAQIPLAACDQRPYHVLLAHAAQGVGGLVTLATAYMMTVSGFVEAVSRAMCEKADDIELFA